MSTALSTAPAVPAWGMSLDGTTAAGAVSERVRHAAQIVLIVAIAVVLIAGIVAYSLVAYQCIKRGYSRVGAYGPNGWKVWQLRIVCIK